MKIIALVVATGAALSPLHPGRQAGPGEDVIYWDTLVRGQLTGGALAVDPSDPLHAAVGPLVPAESAAVTIVNNGPSNNRVDLVLVGDGYTATELNVYSNDANALVASFFNESPLDAYSAYFNVHRVDVISNESGVDNDPVQGVTKDTALDMAYWCSGIERLLCVNVSKALSQAASAPDVDQVLALANSSKYGGAGYPSSDLGTLAADNSSAVEIAKHEFGHSFANLADEYDYGGSTNWTGGEPGERNVSTYDAATMASLQAKWHRWLGTPGVGTYEGANYSQFGIFRPTANSKMRNLWRPFEEINTERLLVKIYQQVDPIDDATPAGVYGSSAVLFVDPVDPSTHALDVQWYLNGNPITGATGTTLDVGALGLTSGTHTVAVTVVDNTPLVINETKRAALMTESRAWTIADGPVNYCTAGLTASGCQVVLVPSGTPSASQSSGFVVAAPGVEGDKDGMFFYGFSGRQANSWGSSSSVHCVTPPLLRTPVMTGTGTTGACDGALGRDFNAYWSSAPTGKVPAAGQKLWLQLWFRDPQNTSNQTTSFSDALEIAVGP